MTIQETLAICGYALTPGHFSTRQAKTVTPDFRVFALLADVFYMASDGKLYCLPKGSMSDLASIPRPFWSILPPQGSDGAEYALAAFGHDCAYRNTLKVWDGAAWILATLSKDDSDSLLKDMMAACGVPETTIEIIYGGVRAGGQNAFKNDR